MGISRAVRSFAVTASAAVLCAVADGTGAVITFDGMSSDAGGDGTVSAGQTVTGTTDVTFTVHADPDDEPTAAVVSIAGGTEYQGTGTVKQTIALNPGDCLPSCTLHATLDTAATQQFGGATNGVAAPLVNDGANTVHIEVDSPRPRTVTADAAVTVDNGRPVVTLPDLPGEDAWTTYKPVGLSADGELSLRATATGDNGVSRVRYFSSGKVWPAPVDLTAPDSGATWTTTLDTSAVPAGLYAGGVYVVAYDKDGRAGSPVRADTVVDHGFTVTPKLGTVVHPDEGSVNVTYAYPSPLDKAFPSNLNYAYPVGTTVSLDGKVQATTPVDAYTYQGNTKGFVADLGTLPYGSHTLTFDTVDNRGAHGRTDLPVQVVSEVTPAWTDGFQDFPVAGSSRTYAATTSADDGVSRAEHWTLDVDGTAFATGSYPAQPSGTWKTTTTGVHYVTLTIVSQYGDTTVRTVPMRVLAATTTQLTGPATSAYGGKATFTATVAQTGAQPAAGAKVGFQYKRAGTTTWKTRATVTADSTGKATYTTTAQYNGAWRAVTAAKNLTWASSTSKTLASHVKAVLTVSRPAARAVHGKAVSYTALSSPYVKGTALRFQARQKDGTWKTLTSAALSTGGSATAKIAFSRAGTWTLRVYRPGTTDLTDTYSSSWTVKVS
ncbi:Ig-like domain-containing protein [Streptomyces sp. NPDC048277]|uniref:Ig-like domain-containing protein n=1 Tax=Streptomyces sp. NPDC048277 TaxID=3155027 RepID=UPI0033D66C00